MRQSPRLTALARHMRHSPTEAERILWFALRDRRLYGLKFRRQVPFGPHIADFYCPAARLVVECDGGGHHPARDAARDEAMRQAGLNVLRFATTDILTNLAGVLTVIAERAKGPLI